MAGPSFYWQVLKAIQDPAKHSEIELLRINDHPYSYNNVQFITKKDDKILMYRGEKCPIYVFDHSLSYTIDAFRFKNNLDIRGKYQRYFLEITESTYLRYKCYHEEIY